MFEKMLKDETGQDKLWSPNSVLVVFTVVFCMLSLGLSGCGGKSPNEVLSVQDEESVLNDQDNSNGENIVKAVNFDHELDGYEPLKKEYNFYFTYKMVHPWWDAVALGIEDAARQYEDMGIVINYEYLAPNEVSARDQIRRLSEASLRDFDVIGVDVADVSIVTPAINELMEAGQKVMTFSSSDASREDGCDRIAYVGNTHNYQDGADLTQALCEKLGFCGKVVVLVGTKGAPCHEERALGVQDVIAQYPDMKIVEFAYDEDNAEKAYELTRDFLSEHEDIAGIVCCNMSNPVGYRGRSGG